MKREMPVLQQLAVTLDTWWYKKGLGANGMSYVSAASILTSDRASLAPPRVMGNIDGSRKERGSNAVLLLVPENDGLKKLGEDLGVEARGVEAGYFIGAEGTAGGS